VHHGAARLGDLARVAALVELRSLAERAGERVQRTASVRRGGLIVPLIVLPLLSPVVIFGAGAVLAALDDISNGALPLLAAFSLGAVLLAPFAAAAALRLHLSA